MFSKVFCCVILLQAGVYCAQLPPEIVKCGRKDPNFEECMAKTMTDTLVSLKDGNKVLGFPQLEPFYVEKLEISADPGKSVKLEQKYKNVWMYGMTDAAVKKFSLKDDGKTCLWEMEVFTKGTQMRADYELTGQVLVFPINGYGKCNVTLTGITNKQIAECEHYMKKGKRHMRFKNYKMDLSVEACHFDFPNIIPGNEQISNELSKTINENALEIFEDVKGGFEQILSTLHLNGANSVFAKYSEDELFLS